MNPLSLIPLNIGHMVVDDSHDHDSDSSLLESYLKENKMLTNKKYRK